jgi:hypothetical protein
VLAAAVAQPPLEDATQAGPAGEVEEDHRVGGFQADRQGGCVVPVDDPPGRGDQFALQAGERLLAERLPLRVVVQGIEVNGRDAEAGGEDGGQAGLAAAPAANDGDPLPGHGR